MQAAPFVLAVAVFLLPTRAYAWDFHEDAATGAQAATDGVAGSGRRGVVHATLVISHRRGAPPKVVTSKNTTEPPVSIELCVDKFESVKGFDFLPFEGPDAPAAGKRLVTVTIDAGAEHFAKTFRQGGWINRLAWLLPGGAAKNIDATVKGEDDFTFGVGDGVRDADDLVAITRILRQSPTRIEIAVTDSEDPKNVLRFLFSTEKVGEVIARLMR